MNRHNGSAEGGPCRVKLYVRVRVQEFAGDENSPLLRLHSLLQLRVLVIALLVAVALALHDGQDVEDEGGEESGPGEEGEGNAGLEGLVQA